MSARRVPQQLLTSRRARAPWALLTLAVLLSTAGCRLKAVAPPYDTAPPSTVLLQAATSRISSLQVPAAKVRIGRAPAGNLMFLAQAPGRFSGQVQLAGRELVSLAFHEDGYALRNVAAEGLPAGFYAGPPADCAIRTLIGVPFATHDLVALVLGGAPQLPQPITIVSQSWDRKLGHEVLRLRSTSAEQELRFAWVAGAWWVAGSTLWRRDASGQLLRQWSLVHEGLRPVGATVLPSVTRLSRPTNRREERVVITYRTQILNPDLGESSAGDDGGDDDGWEDGWEDEDTADAEDTPAPAQASASPPKPVPAKAVQIPPQFKLDGAGLTARGDLCR